MHTFQVTCIGIRIVKGMLVLAYVALTKQADLEGTSSTFEELCHKVRLHVDL